MPHSAKTQPFRSATDYQDARLTISVERRRVWLDGAPMKLPNREFDVLAILASNEGHPVSREELLTRLWGFPPDLKSRTLDVHIHRLRDRLKDHEGLYLETVFGVGYRLRRFGDPPVESRKPDTEPSPAGGDGGPGRPMGVASARSMSATL